MKANLLKIPVLSSYLLVSQSYTSIIDEPKVLLVKGVIKDKVYQQHQRTNFIRKVVKISENAQFICDTKINDIF